MWENKNILHISVDNNTKEDGPKEELSNLQDNLYDKVQKKYQDMCQDIDNNLCWYYYTEYTDDLYPPCAGEGNQISFCLDFTLMSGFGNM